MIILIGLCMVSIYVLLIGIVLVVCYSLLEKKEKNKYIFFSNNHAE